MSNRVEQPCEIILPRHETSRARESYNMDGVAIEVSRRRTPRRSRVVPVDPGRSRRSWQQRGNATSSPPRLRWVGCFETSDIL
jgi:hypothetical protein